MQQIIIFGQITYLSMSIFHIVQNSYMCTTIVHVTCSLLIMATIHLQTNKVDVKIDNLVNRTVRYNYYVGTALLGNFWPIWPRYGFNYGGRQCDMIIYENKGSSPVTKAKTILNETNFFTRTYALNLPLYDFFCSACINSISLLVQSNLFVGYKENYIIQNQQCGGKLNWTIQSLNVIIAGQNAYAKSLSQFYPRLGLHRLGQPQWICNTPKFCN